MSLPVIPVHTISKRGVISAKIQAIQVGVVTVVVPPGSLKPNGTVCPFVIIIPIFSAKWSIAVPRERVPSSSCDIKSREKKILCRDKHSQCFSYFFIRVYSFLKLKMLTIQSLTVFCTQVMISKSCYHTKWPDVKGFYYYYYFFFFWGGGGKHMKSQKK